MGASDVDRIGARAEIEDIEARLSVADLIDKHNSLSSGPAASGPLDGVYPMAALRRMMKSDMELYDAMGPVRKFAANNPNIVSLEKSEGSWKFFLKPGARQSLLPTASRAASYGKQFYGPKPWVYFDFEKDSDRECIASVRRYFRDTMSSMAGGKALLREERDFLSTFGWALNEDWKTN